MPPTTVARVLETALYAEDLAAADRFYGTILGLERLAFVEGRHVFFRCGVLHDRRGGPVCESRAAATRVDAALVLRAVIRARAGAKRILAGWSSGRILHAEHRAL